jgi:GH24 family phage-related lysozyme (muramidase)
MDPMTGVGISIGLMVASVVAQAIPQDKVVAQISAFLTWCRFMVDDQRGGAKRGAVISAALIALIGPIAAQQLYQDVPKHEGTVKVGYKDPAGIPTKCTGDTMDVELGRIYTDEECRVSLDSQLLAHAKPVLKCSPQLLAHPYILAATIDMTYNIGAHAYCTSTTAAKFAAGDFVAGCNAMLAFNKQTFRIRPKKYDCTRKKDGNWLCVLPGLVTRREDNRDVCMRGLVA